jgi:hypothetical protein
MAEHTSLDAQLQELWLKVPEEERRELLTYAQSRAVETCALFTLIGFSTAIGLQTPWLLLAILVLLPITYQIVSGRLWRELKPQTLVRYFVAGSTAQQFAEQLHSRDPSLKLIFRGSLQTIPVKDDIPPETQEQFAEELREEIPAPCDVWISLFPDSLVIISEGDNGAQLEFAHSTLQNFAVALDTPEEAGAEHAANRLLIQTTDEDIVTGRWVLSSPHTETLLACERKIRFFAERGA